MWWWRRKAAEDDAPTPAHLRAGAWGEAQAERFLKRQGMKCLGRRVRFGPREELDLVMRDGEVLVFVEVKTRRSERFGRPVASVKTAKRRVLSRAAVHYLKALRYPKIHFRFDVVEVIGLPGDAEPHIRHLENVFTLDARYQLP